MIWIQSDETEKLKELIKKKKDYLSTLKSDRQAKRLQEEIMFLQEDILPIVLRRTNIMHSEVAKFTTQSFDELIDSKYAKCYNGMLLYIHFNDDIKPPFSIPHIAAFSTIGDRFKAGTPILDGDIALTTTLEELENIKDIKKQEEKTVEKEVEISSSFSERIKKETGI